MTEPKIVIAINKFLANYAWDKSLMTSDATATASRQPDVYQHSNNAIEEFVNASRK